MSALLLNLDTALSAPMTYSTTAFCQMGTTISVAMTCTLRKLAFTAAELLMSTSSCLSSRRRLYISIAEGKMVVCEGNLERLP